MSKRTFYGVAVVCITKTADLELLFYIVSILTLLKSIAIYLYITNYVLNVHKMYVRASL